MPPSSEQNFRANLSQFRWARGVTDESQQAQQSLPSSNPFSRFYNAVAGDYIPLRSSERSNEEEAWFALSRWERYAFKPHFSLPLLNPSPAQAARVRCLPVGRCSLLLRRFHDASFNRVQPRKVRSGIQVRIGLCPSSSNQQLSCSLGSLLVMFGYAICTVTTANLVADCNIFKLRRSHGPNKPRKTSSFEGATTIHPRLLLELGLDPLFLHKRETRSRSSLKHLIYTPVSGPFVLGFPDSRHRADSISGSVCLGVLPRRYPDAALRWTGCSSRRRKPATYLTTSGHYHNCTAISSRLLNHASIRHS